MSYTPKEAAEAIGMSRQGILKAIKTGKISGSKDASGNWRIDAAELHRVYPPLPGLHATVAPQVVTGIQPVDTGLQAQIDGLKALVAQLENERDDLRSQRDKWQHQATALITDRRPWWKRLAG